MSAPPVETTVRPTRLVLFLAFLKIGMLGFGGVAAWARHVLVVECRVLEARDFAESFALASTLPGANTVNLSAMLGYRFCGYAGAAAALAGLIGGPICVLILVAVLYERFGQLADVQAMLFGAAAGAAGIVLGTSLKILRDLEPDLTSVAIVVAVALAAAIRYPMLLILLIAIPLSLAVRFMRDQRQ